MAGCPICEASVGFRGGTSQGELLNCPECGTQLKVISLNPFTLNEAPLSENWEE
tara:strand:+ start:432 stop:593 length:162 start_codon:yes stop_codon:yes gene_type:complete